MVTTTHVSSKCCSSAMTLRLSLVTCLVVISGLSLAVQRITAHGAATARSQRPGTETCYRTESNPWHPLRPCVLP